MGRERMMGREEIAAPGGVVRRGNVRRRVGVENANDRRAAPARSSDRIARPVQYSARVAAGTKTQLVRVYGDEPPDDGHRVHAGVGAGTAGGAAIPRYNCSHWLRTDDHS